MIYTFDDSSRDLEYLGSLIGKLSRLWIDLSSADAGTVLIGNKKVSLIKFRPEDFDAEHCFRTLPHLNRYNGNTEIPFSVGQHSLLAYGVAKALYPENLLIHFFSLKHDFSEGIIGDCISPIKNLPIMAGFRTIEDTIQQQTDIALNVDHLVYDYIEEAVHKVDKLCLSIEVPNITLFSSNGIWKQYIFSKKEVKKHFQDRLAEYDESKFDAIFNLSPKQVEIKLRNTFNDLLEKITAEHLRKQ